MTCSQGYIYYLYFQSCFFHLQPEGHSTSMVFSCLHKCKFSITLNVAFLHKGHPFPSSFKAQSPQKCCPQQPVRWGSSNRSKQIEHSTSGLAYNAIFRRGSMPQNNYYWRRGLQICQRPHNNYYYYYYDTTTQQWTTQWGINEMIIIIIIIKALQRERYVPRDEEMTNKTDYWVKI